jgi:hypothetical protein
MGDRSEGDASKLRDVFHIGHASAAFLQKRTNLDPDCEQSQD